MEELAKIRKDMFELYKSTATYEGGYAIATGALMDFIERIDNLLEKHNVTSPRTR